MKTAVPHRVVPVLLALVTGLAVLVPLAGAARADAPTWVDDTAYDSTYYADTASLTGDALKAELHTIISTNVTTLSYAQVYKDLAVTDADPSNPADVIDFYTGEEMKFADCDGSCTGTNNSNNGLPDEWNREHTWAQSRGGFDTSNGPGTDIFHIRPELESCNSSRGNQWFDNATGTDAKCPGSTESSTAFEPRAAVRGDLARGLLYMAVRYDGTGGWDDLELTDDTTAPAAGHAPSCSGGTCTTAYYGVLSTLLEWNAEDPPDCAEETRNDIIYSQFQHNRNPFIDHPEWVQQIWPGAPTAPAVTAQTCDGTTTPPPADTTPPAVPSGLTATPADGSVTLSWTADTDADLAGYRVYRSAAASGPWTLLTTPAITDTAYTATDLTDGSAYYFAVTAVDTSGNESTRSTAVSATPVAPPPPDTTPPAVPSGLTATPGNGSVALTWTADTDTDLAGYTVYSSPGASGPWTLLTTPAITDTAYTATGLTDGTSYYFKVSAVDAVGNQSVLSAPVSATPVAPAPPDTTPPAIPSGLTATPADGSVGLSWTADTDTDLAGYNVYESTSASGPWTKLTSAPVAGADYTATGLTDGTAYYFAVTAIDTTGNESVTSTPVSATPTAPDTGTTHTTPPVAVDDRATIKAGHTATVDLLRNDHLTGAGSIDSLGGTPGDVKVVPLDSRRVRITVTAGYRGATSVAILYKVRDANGTAAAHLRVTVVLASTTKLTIPKKLKAGKRAKITITVAVGGKAATGKVILTIKHKRIRLTLRHGRATYRLPKLKKGRLTLKASYAGTATAQPSSVTKKVKVKKH